MKIKYVFCFIILFLFNQCKTGELAQIQKEIIKSYPAKFLNKKDFDKSRILMFEKLSPDIHKNDTIILMEYFVDVIGRYYTTLYESNAKSTKRYVSAISIKNKKVQVDSLRLSDMSDEILKLVLKGELDEVQKRGDSAMITPTTTLIINIGIKNKATDKFDFTTMVTRAFSTYED